MNWPEKSSHLLGTYMACVLILPTPIEFSSPILEGKDMSNKFERQGPPSWIISFESNISSEFQSTFDFEDDPNKDTCKNQ